MCNARPKLVRAAAAIAGVATAATLCFQTALHAQRSYRDDLTRLQRIDPDTLIPVRTNEYISSDRADGRVFPAQIAEDVWDDQSRLAVPAIPRGSPAELVVRNTRGGDLVLDLDSVIAHGQRYSVSAEPERIESDQRLSKDAPAIIGGGAVLGTIIGAITGGGKGAAIGAGVGAAAGVGLSIRGRQVRVPAGSVLNFRVDRPLTIGVADRGYDRDRRHFHRDSDRPFDDPGPPPPPDERN
jgi:hypothetical protein